MRSDWTFRWWDLLTLLAVLAASALVFQYAVARGSDGAHKGLRTPCRVWVNLERPEPEVAAAFQLQDRVLDRQGRPVAEITALRTETHAGARSGDLMVELRVTGNLRLARKLEGFPAEPADLRVGVWCLLATERAEASGRVLRIEPLK